MNEIQQYFKQHGYVVIKNFLDRNTAFLLNEYCKTVVTALDFKLFNSPEDYNRDWDGNFGDAQIPHTFHRYGDPMIDTLMLLSTNKMQEFTGLNLNPNYTYWRFYQKGDQLLRHKDRPSCEISTTLCLGYDVSDVDSTMYSNYTWPIWIQGLDGTESPAQLEPGDMIIYRGCDLDHWREKFKGKYHTQAFMHYSDIDGPFNIKYDTRPILGIPGKFREDKQ
jgi:hypothetical protein